MSFVRGGMSSNRPIGYIAGRAGRVPLYGLSIVDMHAGIDRLNKHTRVDVTVKARSRALRALLAERSIAWELNTGQRWTGKAKAGRAPDDDGAVDVAWPKAGMLQVRLRIMGEVTVL